MTHNYIVSCRCRLAYAVWMLENIISKHLSSGSELYFMYDIACTLFRHLQVSIPDFTELSIPMLTIIIVPRPNGYTQQVSFVPPYISLLWTQGILSGMSYYMYIYRNHTDCDNTGAVWAS